MSPFLEALGAGLGITETSPMVKVLAVPKELKPDPVTTTVSSTAASPGASTIVGLGTAKAVVLPAIVPTVATTILVPGVRDPPPVAGGISVVSVKAPFASVTNPPTGRPLASAKVKAVPVVFGGNALPVITTILPVDAEAGVTVTVPVGIFRLAVALRTVARPPAEVSVVVFSTPALSFAVNVYVVGAALVGIVTVPSPDPSEPIGNLMVPGKVRVTAASDALAAVMVNSAFLPATSPLSTVIPVTVTVTDCPGPAVDGDKVSVLAVLANPLEVLAPFRPLSSSTLKVMALLEVEANAPKVGTVVA